VCEKTKATNYLFVELVHDLEAIITRDSQRKFDVASLVFIPSKASKQFIHIYATFTFLALESAQPYFLLIDRAEGAAGMWLPHLRYLEAWAKRTAGTFPPLLIVSPSHFRAGAMLRLAHMHCKSLTVAATGRRDIALTEGLLAIAKQPKGWRVMLPNGRLVTVDPFAWPAMPREAYEQSSFAISKLQKRAERAPAKSGPPEELQRLERFNALNQQQQQLLAFLSRNPVIPESVIVTFLKRSPADVQRDLLLLEDAGFAQRTPSKFSEPIWSASDGGAGLRFQREMQPANHLRRYRFFRADHERRLMHTLAVYRFFASIQQHCERRSRATRKLDAKPNVPSDGHVPMFALKAWESEFNASDVYRLHGQTHFWRPDGYGAVRTGKTTTHFWLERDGTANAPSRFDPAVWAGKLGRLCDYGQSTRWRLRYPKLPHLLIVTTDLRNVTHIYDALVEAAQARNMRSLPSVWVAGSAAVQQRGPLAKVWRDVTQEDDAWNYAFDGLETCTVQPNVPKRVNILDELQRAERLGLLPDDGD
jgi:hypothetical protein